MKRTNLERLDEEERVREKTTFERTSHDEHTLSPMKTIRWRHFYNPNYAKSQMRESGWTPGRELPWCTSPRIWRSRCSSTRARSRRAREQGFSDRPNATSIEICATRS